MMRCDYEELEHTAEIGLRVRAATPAALFACAATGMFALIDAQPGEQRMRHVVTIESSDAESLLVDWLSELLYWHERDGEIYYKPVEQVVEVVEDGGIARIVAQREPAPSPSV